MTLWFIAFAIFAQGAEIKVYSYSDMFLRPNASPWVNICSTERTIGGMVTSKVNEFNIYLVAQNLLFTETPREYIKRVIPRSFSFAIIDSLIDCESGWNPQAKHWNPPTPTRPGSWDVGLWQINDIHGLSVEDRMDVYKSTEYAIKLMTSTTGLSHWVCYTKLYGR